MHFYAHIPWFSWDSCWDAGNVVNHDSESHHCLANCRTDKPTSSLNSQSVNTLAETQGQAIVTGGWGVTWGVYMKAAYLNKHSIMLRFVDAFMLNRFSTASQFLPCGLLVHWKWKRIALVWCTYQTTYINILQVSSMMTWTQWSTATVDRQVDKGPCPSSRLVYYL